MKIHPLWIVCITIRIILLLFIYYLNCSYNFNPTIHTVSLSLLFIIGFGFIYKGFTGSNNETQIAKVFWNDSRFIHGSLYIGACLCLFCKQLNNMALLLGIDLAFSFAYRLYINR